MGALQDEVTHGHKSLLSIQVPRYLPYQYQRPPNRSIDSSGASIRVAEATTLAHDLLLIQYNFSFDIAAFDCIGFTA